MTARIWAAARYVPVIVLLFGLIACGDNEPAQRKAFIEFLQTRIVGKPGVHVAKPTAEETASFGDYARHYAVITDFNAGLDQSVSKPLREAMAKGAPHSLGEVVSRRGDFAAVQAGMAAIRGALDQQLATADAAHAALKQPDDLKPVYDAAYDRDVTQPAKALIDIFPDVDGAMKGILTLADFLDQHRAAIKINGPMIQTTDPALQSRLQALIDNLRDKQEAIQKAQQRLRAVAYGS